MARHKQKRISANGFRGTVDEGIAELIKSIWRNGIPTCMSCEENHPGVAWIAFWDADAYQAFATILYKMDQEFFWPKMIGNALASQLVSEQDRWHSAISIVEYGSNGLMQMLFSLRFPARDIKYMSICLNEFACDSPSVPAEFRADTRTIADQSEDQEHLHGQDCTICGAPTAKERAAHGSRTSVQEQPARKGHRRSR